MTFALPEIAVVFLIASHIAVLAAGIAIGIAVARPPRDGEVHSWSAVPPIPRCFLKDFEKLNRKDPT